MSFTRGWGMVQRLRHRYSCQPKFLLVEDNKNNLQALTLYRQVMGLIVEQAQDGFEALRKLDNETFGVVSDIGMPGLNGLDLATRIHDKFGSIPIVLMTGDTTARTNESLMRSVCHVFDQAIFIEGTDDDHP